MTATFDIDRDIDLAVQDVQAKVAQIQRTLPTGVQPPTVSKSNPDDTPIITVGVSGPFARQLLADVARYQLQDALTTIEGVGQVQMMGYLDRAVRIWVDADKLIATSTTVTDITTALKNQHVTSSGGQMTNGQKAIDVRVLGEAADLDTIRNIVIKKVGTSIIHLSDVALVQDGFEDETSKARSNDGFGRGSGSPRTNWCLMHVIAWRTPIDRVLRHRRPTQHRDPQRVSPARRHGGASRRRHAARRARGDPQGAC